MCTMKEFLVSNCSRVLMYEGSSGYGKSQILMEIEYLAQGENHRTIAIALTKIGFHQNFYTIQILMANVLGLDACKHYKERQTNLQNKVKTLLDEKFYCLLNDLFHVQASGGSASPQQRRGRRQRLPPGVGDFASLGRGSSFPFLMRRVWVTRKRLPTLPEGAATLRPPSTRRENPRGPCGSARLTSPSEHPCTSRGRAQSPWAPAGNGQGRDGACPGMSCVGQIQRHTGDGWKGRYEPSNT